MLKWMALVFISFSAVAAPRDIEVWLLSNSKVTQLEELLNRPQYVFGAKTAELACQEMGDFCFDPQYGLYKKEDTWGTVNAEKVEKSAGPSIPTGKGIDQDLINCDPKNHFDMFCGKAKPIAKDGASFELWIDTSSSMREFDFSDKEGGCYRKSLVNRLDKYCPFNQKVNVMMFDTGIKQAGSMDALCTNRGPNDVKRLIDWIERSEAKKLVIITDIYELHKEFADYIESKNGSFRGDKKALTAAQMLDLVDELAKSCK
jgi:hypothetical protein